MNNKKITTPLWGALENLKTRHRFSFIAGNNNKSLRDSYSFAVTLLGPQVSSRVQFDRIVQNTNQVSYSASGPVLVSKGCRNGSVKDTSPPILNSVCSIV